MFDFGYLNIDLSTPRTWFTQDIYESWEKKNIDSIGKVIKSTSL